MLVGGVMAAIALGTGSLLLHVAIDLRARCSPAPSSSRSVISGGTLLRTVVNA